LCDHNYPLRFSSELPAVPVSEDFQEPHSCFGWELFDFRRLVHSHKKWFVLPLASADDNPPVIDPLSWRVIAGPVNHQVSAFFRDSLPGQLLYKFRRMIEAVETEQSAGLEAAGDIFQDLEIFRVLEISESGEKKQRAIEFFLKINFAHILPDVSDLEPFLPGFSSCDFQKTGRDVHAYDLMPQLGQPVRMPAITASQVQDSPGPVKIQYPHKKIDFLSGPLLSKHIGIEI